MAEDEDDPVRIIRSLVRDPEKAMEFVSAESEDADQLRRQVNNVLKQVGESSAQLFEEKTEKELKVSKQTLAWLAVLRHIINEMDCSVDDAESLWYIG